jgi:CobQ-like glutamine amidotransferase family enzyme
VSGHLRIAVVYPDLLGTYGDGGNGLILSKRAEWRGLDTELLQADSTRPLPDADLYCLGGGEDGPQVRAARALLDDGTLPRRVADGAVVLAVCAGYQIVGQTFPGSDGAAHEGLGLLPINTIKGEGPRAVGEIMADISDQAGTIPGLSGLPTLSGFENHGGHTTLDGALPLAMVTSGTGNGGGDGTEGAVQGRVVGTYLHGPVLARNPELADALLAWALGVGADSLSHVDDHAAHSLRDERLAHVKAHTHKAGNSDRRKMRRAERRTERPT